MWSSLSFVNFGHLLSWRNWRSTCKALICKLNLKQSCCMGTFSMSTDVLLGVLFQEYWVSSTIGTTKEHLSIFAHGQRKLLLWRPLTGNESRRWSVNGFSSCDFYFLMNKWKFKYSKGSCQTLLSRFFPLSGYPQSGKSFWQKTLSGPPLMEKIC